MKKHTDFKFRILLVLCISLFSISINAQDIEISGQVVNIDGEPIIGATVMVKGTSNGTITDIDGNFKLNAQNGALLQISYIGFRTTETSAQKGKELNIILKEDSEILEEVVVVGYGTQNKANISGSVSTVVVDELPKVGSPSIGTMLRGRSSGTNITQNSANPGSALNIAIRGALSGQAPLIVIDGVPQVQAATVGSGTAYSGGKKDNTLININPNDIESINILKDASAASIYGSDASGGVILITTKRGKAGRPEISYSGSTAFQYLSDKPEYMNAKDFMIQQNMVFDELGRSNEKFFTEDQIKNFVGEGTDWLDEVTRVGVVNEHNLSITTGSENTKVLASVSYYDHKAIAKNNSLNRITGRTNIEQKLGKSFSLGINASFAQVKYHDVPLEYEESSLISSAMKFIPTVPVYDENGNYSINPIRDLYDNPVSLLDIKDQTVNKDLSINGFLEYKPIKDLSIKATFGFDMKDTQADQYIPTTTKEGFRKNGQASKQNAKNQINLVNIIANYNKTIADIHDLSIMGGWEYKKTSWEGMGIVATQFPYDGSETNNIGTSLEEKPNISSYKGSNEMASFFGRLNYVLNDRYILTVNTRADGSSNFSSNHQWAVFSGVSAAWRINEESWMKRFDNLSNLKLRFGVGQTGNAGNLTGINSFYKISGGVFAPNGQLVNGASLSNLGNKDLKWETLTDYNIGLDWGIFNNRLSGSVELYQRLRKDVILTKQLMSYNELRTIDFNSKDIYRSRGIDIEIHSVNFDNKNFGWYTDINFSYYVNRTIQRDPDFIPEVYQDMNEKWGNVYGFRTDGLIQIGEQYEHLPKSVPGCIYYQDLYSYEYDEKGNKLRDKDGRYIRTLKPDGVLDDADIVVLGNSTPIPFSINNSFRWKNWDANIYLYGSLNGLKMNDIELQSVFTITDITSGKNALSVIKDRWSYNNQDGTLPGVFESNSSFNPNRSDFFLEKAWYLRLDNISIGYTFQNQWLKKYINNIRLYASARNLYVFTPYNGMDPETGNGTSPYPNQRTFAIGLDIKF